jgi:transcriptional regulator with XRE-family HTH domain
MPKSEALAKLGLRIRKIRKAKGMSQEELGFASELDRTYISDLERGNRNPSYLGLRKLEIGLETTLSEILANIDDESI